MSKTIRCYKYVIKKDNVDVEEKFLKDIINVLFSSKDVKILPNGNKVNIIKCNDEENYISLEKIETVSGIEKEIYQNEKVDDQYMFFRIGREKDIDGAMKRNLKTWEGTELIEKDKQDSYNLEICTYILIDTVNGIVLELYGLYAPTVRSLKNIVNTLIDNLKIRESKLNGISFDYYNIMSKELVESLSNNGERLGKISYKYANPKLDFLKHLGLTSEEINVIKETGVYEVEVQLKGQGRVPLTKNSDIIKKVISTFKKSPKRIKDNIIFRGKTGTTSSKNYTFKEEEVTYNIDLKTVKKVDNKYIKLDLNEIAYKVYKSLTLVYNKEKGKIKSYLN